MLNDSRSDKTNAYIASRVLVPDPCPEVVMTVAPCRSGTTAQLRIFSQAGLPSYHQPLKAILRAHMEGEDIQYSLPNKPFFIKEAIGPYTYDESAYDPLAILVNAGVPSEKIHLITMLREPLSTIVGWIQAFSFKAEKDTLIQNAITAYETVQSIRQEALSSGLHTMTLVYEAFRGNDPSIVIHKLFDALGLTFSSEILSGWDRLPPLKSPESNIFFPPQPKLEWYSGHNIHKKAETAEGFSYHGKSGDSIDQVLSLQQVERINTSEMSRQYDEFRIACGNEFNIEIRASYEFDEFRSRHEGRSSIEKIM